MTARIPSRKPTETSLDSLQQALDDLARSRERAEGEVRAGIDSAVERIREVHKDLSARAPDEAGGMHSQLEHASDQARWEFGRAALGAQRTREGLTHMSGK